MRRRERSIIVFGMLRRRGGRRKSKWLGDGKRGRGDGGEEGGEDGQVDLLRYLTIERVSLWFGLCSSLDCSSRGDRPNFRVAFRLVQQMASRNGVLYIVSTPNLPIPYQVTFCRSLVTVFAQLNPRSSGISCVYQYEAHGLFSQLACQMRV
jgi:hypothetical protein